jgi:ankyrin repeat protein
VEEGARWFDRIHNRKRFAVLSGDRGDPVVPLLLKAGADVNMKDSVGKTALSVAQERGATDIVEMLKQAGAES